MLHELAEEHAPLSQELGLSARLPGSMIFLQRNGGHQLFACSDYRFVRLQIRALLASSFAMLTPYRQTPIERAGGDMGSSAARMFGAFNRACYGRSACPARQSRWDRPASRFA